MSYPSYCPVRPDDWEDTKFSDRLAAQQPVTDVEVYDPEHHAMEDSEDFDREQVDEDQAKDWCQQAWEDDMDKDTREAVWNGIDDSV